MKIQCDVCEKAEATMFCPSDEAALCHGCDHTIHRANKLATKHTRFSLVHLNSKDYPLCDICQERRGYLFCQEDRAILCRECDLPIHGANQHTQKHNRFLLSGVKLSSNSLDPDSSSTSIVSEARNYSSRSKANIIPTSVSNENASSSCMVEDNMASDTGSVSTSSISEYLIETIPGYCFEDLLDASFPPNGFCKKQKQNHYSAFQYQDIHVNKFFFSSSNVCTSSSG
ncbi:putative transcription factor interactor and regulator Znf-B family [Medicago truncatula]|uniref:Putative transcription factor interactor and regulator Znf-B family n=2 Tax=Medicago truncatula TaxID=3880 RepID=G7J7R4_MEDTR|nr:B-box zinc finger protein 20 isoform X1 [Medicago truncatula]AES74240.1 salt tolerance-like protein [Medicago truncatula]RHN71329.1 putative transcription factor interactor and regulator Znf-B family [Medicago truncatula]